jgi:membrane fusion protein, copper/silver efflux system
MLISKNDRMKPRSNKYLKYSLLLIAGIFLGWLFFHNPKPESNTGLTMEEEKNTTWTCSMHPQIRMDKPGDCPICGMDLIPLGQSGDASYDPAAIHLSREAAQLASVMTSIVTSQKPEKEVRLYGKVKIDERLLQSQVAHVPGRIERLNVNFTGETVKRGQLLAEIYSPDLITAQQELLQTYRTRELQPGLYEASRERLKQWKLSDDQIKEIESSGKYTTNIRIYSNTTGTVTARYVSTGDYVAQGTVLFEIADLSKVWVLFDAYESDLPFLSKGTKVTFTLQSLPGKEYSGDISFINPVIDPVTRVAGVRVEINNTSGELKPEMFVTGIVNSDLAASGDELIIPASAVLWTGKRSLVYVKEPGDEMIFKMRMIELGPMLGNSYIVMDGLSEGEEIVTNGTFSVDAAAQLEGKPSMMNPAGGETSTGHQHEEMQEPVRVEKLSVDDKFLVQLEEVYNSYLLLKNALVQTDAARAKEAASGLRSSLGKADMKLLKGEAHDKWMELYTAMEKSIKSIASAGDIGAQREGFSSLSNRLFSTIQTFGIPGKTVYWQYCPMAFNDKGAYWLSELKEIRNPYFGDEMLTCGETRETLEF